MKYCCILHGRVCVMNYVVYVLRGFFFLLMHGMGCVILLWYSLSLPYNYFVNNVTTLLLKVKELSKYIPKLKSCLLFNQNKPVPIDKYQIKPYYSCHFATTRTLYTSHPLSCNLQRYMYSLNRHNICKVILMKTKSE